MATSSGVLGHRFDVAGLQGTGVLSYNSAVTSVDGLPGGSKAPTSIGHLSSYVNTVHPETGNKIEGFRWDNRILADDEEENWDASIPVNWDATTSGVEGYFQSGIGDGTDLELLEIEEVVASGMNDQAIFGVWAPKVNHGYYYDFEKEGYLYSDDSEIVYPSFSGVIPGVLWEGVNPNDATRSGFNSVEMRSFPKVGVPITAIQTRWNAQYGKYEPYVQWQKKVDFSGRRDSDLVRQSTRNPYTDAIYWDLLDRDELEFIVSYSGVTNSSGFPDVIFNQQCVEPVGSTHSGVTFSGLEIVGTSTGADNQEFHLEFSPVDQTRPPQIYSFTTTPAGYISEESLSSGVAGGGLVGGGPLYSGILETGNLDVTVKEWLPAVVGTTFSGYQCNIDYDFGIVSFGDTSYSGVEVPGAGELIAVGYWKTFRVEYEPQDTLDSVLAIEANLNPIYRHAGDGFVYLSTALEDPVSITLSSELPLISTNNYGPLNIGNNYAPMIATVKDRTGNTLEGQTVTISLVGAHTVGNFGSGLGSTTAITNKDGNARAYYNPPRTILDIGEEIIYSGYSIDPTGGGYAGVTETTTLRTSDMLIEGDTTDIFLFQNLVDDPILGWMETTVSQDDLAAQLEEYYRTYLLEHRVYGETGLSSVTGQPNDYLTNQTWESAHRALLDLAAPSMFQRNLNMGRKVLVAQPDPAAYDPHSVSSNAWAPKQPIDIIEVSDGVYDLVYDTSTYSIPVPSGTAGPTTSGDLHSYFVVAPTIIQIQASVYNERLQQAIFSNIVEVHLTIPEYMSGLWTLDEINEIHIDEINTLLSGVAVDPSKKMPLGFRFRTSNVALAGALDGITFLDVNPQYNANVWDTSEVTPLGHRFEITSIT